MERHPEEDNHSEHQAEGHDAVFRLARRKFLDSSFLFASGLLSAAFHVLERAAETVVDQHGDNQ